MSRSGYSDDCDDELAMGRWRGMLASATRGKRGQAFFKDLVAALDAMPEKALIANELELDGEVCAMGALGKARGIDMSNIDPLEPQDVADAFNVAECLVQEVAYWNDEWGPRDQTPAMRWQRMRDWTAKQIAKAEGRDD